MKRIRCSQCNKFLFETDKSWGAAGAEAQRLGFVFKLPVMYTGKYERLFFCNHTCAKTFYKANIPSDTESDRLISEAKAKIPEYAAECASRLKELIEWPLLRQMKAEYFIAISTDDSRELTYILARRVNKEIEVLMARSVSDKSEFENDIRTLAKCFSATVIK